jgi:hypothetical protein
LVTAAAVRIDAGPELNRDQYPLHYSDRAVAALEDPEDLVRTTHQYRYFNAQVRRVFLGCEELEDDEQVIISVPIGACAIEQGIITSDGTLTTDLLFGTVTSMTFPLDGTMQVLEVDPCLANAQMNSVSKETRNTLREYGTLCYDNDTAAPANLDNLRGSSVNRL